jgi:hypothetical protein
MNKMNKANSHELLYKIFDRQMKSCHELNQKIQQLSFVRCYLNHYLECLVNDKPVEEIIKSLESINILDLSSLIEKMKTGNEIKIVLCVNSTIKRCEEKICLFKEQAERYTEKGIDLTKQIMKLEKEIFIC